MAGTRLAVHAIFVIELLLLVVVSFRYASTRRHDPFSSAEPFLADQSGWPIVVEDVSPVPSSEDDVGIIDYAADCAAAIVSQISALMGVEPERNIVPKRPRRPSAFVQELRQQMADFPHGSGDGNSYNEFESRNRFFPPLIVNLSIPQVDSSTTATFFAEALERGFQRQTAQKTYPGILLQTVESSSDSNSMKLCDEFSLPEPPFRGSHRALKFPEIIIIMGCSSAYITDRHLSSIEVDERSGTVIVRTVLTVDRKNELQRHLEEDVSRTLSSVLFVPLTNTNGHRVGRVSIQVIDENPASHAAEAANGLTAKAHFDTLGKVLFSFITPALDLLLKDLSFIYGGNIEVNHDGLGMTLGSTITTNDAISLEAHSSAYLTLPDSIIKSESDGEKTPIKSVSSEGLANWMFTSSRQRKKPTSDVEWVLFVPSQVNSPLMVRDESSGGEGKSIILSSPHRERESTNNAYPNGISIVNLPRFTATDDLGKLSLIYKENISQSLVYLVGFLRAIHGLSPVASAPPDRSDSTEQNSVQFHKGIQEHLSFWELEAIARSHYYLSLELAFSETDTLMALLHQHSRTLALPMEVAHKLNNATHLLRESILLVEKGFPLMYATSLLHGSLQHIQSVKSDDRFMELPYFGPDHFLAVFSPLVLPLILPMAAGLIREVKRFRKLQLSKVA